MLIPNNIQKSRIGFNFEFLCYIFAGICAIAFFMTPTSRNEIVNLDGSYMALRWEIAFFGWLIVGRITALINKKNDIKQEQQPPIESNTSDKLSEDPSEA